MNLYVRCSYIFFSFVSSNNPVAFLHSFNRADAPQIYKGVFYAHFQKVVAWLANGLRFDRWRINPAIKCKNFTGGNTAGEQSLVHAGEYEQFQILSIS